MKKIFVLIGLAFLISTTTLVAAPFEFFATISGNPGNTVPLDLDLEITSSVTISVLVTSLTEIKDTDGTPITIGDISEGNMVAVEAFLTGTEFVALEIQRQSSLSEFELRGIVGADDIDEAAGTIVLNGLQVHVEEGVTDIKDEDGTHLSLSELKQKATDEGDLWLKIEGYVNEDLVASEIKIPSMMQHAKINLQGIVGDFTSENSFELDLGGGTTTLVNVLPGETDIVGGGLASGLFVLVKGYIADDLSIDALRIRIKDLIELHPDELELGFGETGDVTVLLRQALAEDLVLALSSNDDAIASVDPELTIPAGELMRTFGVQAHDVEGKTTVEVALPAAYGSLTKTVKVEVGDPEDGDNGDKPLELEWNPRVVRAAPQEVRQVRLRLKHGVAPENIPVLLVWRHESDDLDVEVDPWPEVEILEGAESAIVELTFGSETGSGILRAQLPESLGGDIADLDIRLDPPEPPKIKIQWSSKKITASSGESVVIQLLLDQPAPEGLKAFVTLRGGDGSLASFDSLVVFGTGETQADVNLTTGDPGKVRVRAALPWEFGGMHSDLEIKIE
jgi:hypothetical protein